MNIRRVRTYVSHRARRGGGFREPWRVRDASVHLAARIQWALPRLVRPHRADLRAPQCTAAVDSLCRYCRSSGPRTSVRCRQCWLRQLHLPDADPRCRTRRRPTVESIMLRSMWFPLDDGTTHRPAASLDRCFYPDSLAHHVIINPSVDASTAYAACLVDLDRSTVLYRNTISRVF